MAPVLEFFGGQREPFHIDRPEVYIGRGASCTLRLDGDAAAERHARLTLDGAGNVFIQDLDTHSGTLRNGDFVYGVQQLAEGDKIEIGGMALVFRAAAPARAVAPATSAPRATAPMRAGSDERTRMPTELPPEVRAALAARQQQQQAAASAPKPPPPVEAAPAGIIVGTPEPEPDNFRTVQMSPPDLAALGIDPATLPPIAKPVPAAAAPKPAPTPPATSAAKRTMMGMPAPVLPKQPTVKPAEAPLQAPTPSLGHMATAEMQAPKLPATPPAQQPVVSQQPRATMPTMMGAPRPVISPTAPTPLAQPAPTPIPTMQRAVVPPAQAIPQAPAPTPQAAPPPAMPAMKTAQLEAPVVPAGLPLVAAPYSPPAAQPQHPPLQPAPQPTPVAKGPMPQAHAYTPPPKGSFGPFSRALAFMGQIFSLAGQHKALLKPLIWDVIVTTPIMAAFTVLEFFVHSRGGFYAVMGVEAFLLYFVDYACNSVTASLMYDYAMTGEASMATAIPRVKKALPGVITFAAVSALLDMASTYARERNDLVSKLILRVLRAIWTTATYVIMPALVIEGVSFGDAFKRSKALMDRDPTGVGAGIVAMSITSYIVAAVCFPLAYVLLHAGAHIHPAIGALLSMLVVNLYWAVSGWMKIAYATCFYMWARECERTGSTDHALAPLPLRTALDAA